MHFSDLFLYQIYHLDVQMFHNDHHHLSSVLCMWVQDNCIELVLSNELTLIMFLGIAVCSLQLIFSISADDKCYSLWCTFAVMLLHFSIPLCDSKQYTLLGDWISDWLTLTLVTVIVQHACLQMLIIHRLTMFANYISFDASKYNRILCVVHRVDEDHSVSSS